MSNMSFEQATPATADASGTADQSEGTQAQGEVKQANEKELTHILQKRVDDSQSYIKKLQADMAALKAEVEKSRKIEDVFSTMEEQKVRQEPSQEKQASLDTDALIKQAKEETLAALRQESERAKMEENFKFVSVTLANSLGREGLDQKIEAVALENDMTYQEATLLAQTKPKAFLKLFGVKPEAPSPQSSFKSSVNTQAIRSSGKAEKMPDLDTNSIARSIEWMNARAKYHMKNQ